MSTPITQPLTKRSEVASNKKMTLMERIYLPAIIKGMAITLKHFFRVKKATVCLLYTSHPRRVLLHLLDPGAGH